jgi:hypothetical protein
MRWKHLRSHGQLKIKADPKSQHESQSQRYHISGDQPQFQDQALAF